MGRLPGYDNSFDRSDRRRALLERAGKTGSEVVLNFVKATSLMALPAVAMIGLNYLGVPVAEDAKASLAHLGNSIHQGVDLALNLARGSLPKVDLQNIKEIAVNGGAFTAGLTIGILYNFGSILAVLKNLDGKTEGGNECSHGETASGN